MCFIKVKCANCGWEVEKRIGHVNRSKKQGNKLYCDKKCASLGKRTTKEEKKELKRLYDIEYRKRNKERIKQRNRAYNESPAGRATQARARKKAIEKYGKEKHNEYCRRPEQREKEKINRYKRVYGHDWETQTKFCINCQERKHIFEFDAFFCFPDGRRHICNDCENYQKRVLKYSTRETMGVIIARRYTELTRYDIAKHPYLIEAFKYHILLNKLTR